MDAPVREAAGVDLIAIDNLPSLLPVEASTTFSAELVPQLRVLDGGEPWERCLQTYQAAISDE